MNFRNMVLIVLLLPVNSYGKSIDLRIKELKDVQFKKESELSNLSDLLAKRYESFRSYRSIALNFWKALDNKITETYFDKFLDTMDEVFGTAKDVRSIIEKESFDRKHLKSLQIALLRVVLEQRFIEKLAIKYEELITELIKINTELMSLNAKV